MLVGSFEVHVQLQENRVTIRNRLGAHGANPAATALVGRFVRYDSVTREVMLEIVIANRGDLPLFGPIDARVVKFASPFTELLSADFKTGVRYDAGQLGTGHALLSGEATVVRTWRLKSPTAQAFKFDVDVHAGVPLAAGAAAVIEGPGGVSVRVPAGAIPYPAMVTIQPVSLSGVRAPLGQLIGAAAIELKVEAASLGILPPLTRPLTVSVPDPQIGTTQFIVAREEVIDDLQTQTRTPRLVPHDTATAQGDTIVTDGGGHFDGIFAGGVYVILGNYGSGYVQGIVTESGIARSGVIVLNDTNALAARTDSSGRYSLYINGGSFRLTFFDPLRGTGGTADGIINNSGSTVVIGFSLVPLPDPPVTRSGIRNSGFEHGALNGWQVSGAGAVIQRLSATGATILPTEGRWMAAINTGEDSVGGIGSGLRQRFFVPRGVTTLRLDFNFVSEEFPEFVGSAFDDAFSAVVTTPNGDRVFANVSVNASGGYTLIGDCGFPGGDSTCGMTGWREASVNLSEFAEQEVLVALVFSAIDAGDSVYDTHVLVDNIRFSTAWIDAKFLNGTTLADAQARVAKDIAEANDVLSQAGVIVRVRDVRVLPVGGAGLDVSYPPIQLECRPSNWIICTGTRRLVLPREIATVIANDRSVDRHDFNVYYVTSLNGVPSDPRAIAIGADDFWDLDWDEAGILASDDVDALPNNIAHEVGHLIISPEGVRGAGVEHDTPVGNVMSTADLNRMCGDYISPEQSASINSNRIPLLRH